VHKEELKFADKIVELFFFSNHIVQSQLSCLEVRIAPRKKRKEKS
jgi:hypothetical protein